jgi:hypothetical protein
VTLLRIQLPARGKACNDMLSELTAFRVGVERCDLRSGTIPDRKHTIPEFLQLWREFAAMSKRQSATPSDDDY